MESIDRFTLRNAAVKKWLACLLLISACIALIFPPAFWLSVAGGALIVSGSVANQLVPHGSVGMFVFGVALVLGGFYPEAIKARRLLEQHLGAPSA